MSSLGKDLGLQAIERSVFFCFCFFVFEPSLPCCRPKIPSNIDGKRNEMSLRGKDLGLAAVKRLAFFLFLSFFCV